MATTSKNEYIDELQEIDIKYNNTFHFPIKMKAIDFMSDIITEYIP